MREINRILCYSNLCVLVLKYSNSPDVKVIDCNIAVIILTINTRDIKCDKVDDFLKSSHFNT